MIETRSSGWFVVRSECNREVMAAVSIAAKDFTVFFPVRIVTISHAKQQKRLERPLFPRYIFAHGLLERAGETNYCRGVSRKGLIVNSYGEAQTISDQVIMDIKDRERIAKAKAGEIVSGYEAGDKFIVQAGSYADIEAVYLGEIKGKVEALVFLFGRDNVVTLDLEMVPRSPRQEMAA